MTTPRIHFQSSSGITYCGREALTKGHVPHAIDARRPVTTRRLVGVTCRRCLSKCWKEMALAHYRAFGPRGHVGAAIRKAVADAEPRPMTATDRALFDAIANQPDFITYEDE